MQYKKLLSRSFWLAIAGQFFVLSLIAAIPGLQGPFVPIEVVSVQPGPNDTVAVLDYYAQTESYADLYAREADTFSKSEMVGMASDLIGTPWETLTCSELLDVFEEPCAIPPNLEEPEDPPEYVPPGTCTANSTTGYPSPPSPFPSTFGECARFMEDNVRPGWDASAQPTTGATIIVCGANGVGTAAFTFQAPRTGFGLSNMGFFTPTDPGARCSVVGIPPDPAPPTPVPPTTDELYEIIRPAITPHYFYDYSTQTIINNSTINSTATSITNNYNSYSSSHTPGQPQIPPGMQPVPMPPPLAPPTVPTDPSEPQPGSGCEDAPNSLGCADADSAIDAIGQSVSDSLQEDVDMVDGEAAAGQVAVAITDALQGVGDGNGALNYSGSMFDDITGISALFPAPGSCQLFEYMLVPSRDVSFQIDSCDAAIFKVVAEWFFYAMTLVALFRIAVGQRGEA